MPSAAMRFAYGFRRTLPFAKFISGISRRERREGSWCLRFAFFIAFPFVRSGAACADDADDVVDLLGIYRQENPSGVREANKYGSIRMQIVADDDGEFVGKCRDCFGERDSVLPSVR